MSEKKPYYRKRKGSAKPKPSEGETNATSLDTVSSTTSSSDRVVSMKPKRKRYNRKPKSRLTTEAEAWAAGQQSIADTDSRNEKFYDAVTATTGSTIDWQTAVRSTAAERGIDQMGYPIMAPGMSPAEDATKKNSKDATKIDRIRYNSNSDTDTEDNKKRYTSKSDHMLREHRLISALALTIAMLGILCVAGVWWILTH